MSKGPKVLGQRERVEESGGDLRGAGAAKKLLCVNNREALTRTEVRGQNLKGRDPTKHYGESEPRFILTNTRRKCPCVPPKREDGGNSYRDHNIIRPENTLTRRQRKNLEYT